jgi:hypothetical protein
MQFVRIPYGLCNTLVKLYNQRNAEFHSPTRLSGEKKLISCNDIMENFQVVAQNSLASTELSLQEGNRNTFTSIKSRVTAENRKPLIYQVEMFCFDCNLYSCLQQKFTNNRFRGQRSWQTFPHSWPLLIY